MKKLMMVVVTVLLGVVGVVGCGGNSSGVSPVVEYNNAIQAWDRNDKEQIQILSALKGLKENHPEYKRLREKEAELSATQEKLRERIETLKTQL